MFWNHSSGPGSTLEAQRREILAQIEESRVAFEDMAMRAAAARAASVGANLSNWVDVEKIKARFAALVETAKTASDEKSLNQLGDEAQTVATLRAYLCPEKEILTEAKSYIASLNDWGVPRRSLDSLNETIAPALADNPDAARARGALAALYEDYDIWDSYVDDYNRNTRIWARGLLITILGCVGVALFVMLVLPNWLPRPWVLVLRVFSLVIAAVAGAAASVISRLPGLTSYGEWMVNSRAFLARIGTGIVGSLVAIGLLGSGVISITLPAPWTSVDKLFQVCVASLPAARRDSQGTVSTAVPQAPATGTTAGQPLAEEKTVASECTAGGGLFLLALTMLFGFSERLLTSLESRVIPTAEGTQSPVKKPEAT